MLFKNQYRIATARLKNRDYSLNGHYYLTICTNNREPFFGHVNNAEMTLSEIGLRAGQCWRDIPNHFPFVRLDEYVIMPDHIHGIIVIEKNDAPNDAKKIFVADDSVDTNKFGPQSNNMASIIRGFKIGVKKWATMNHIPFAWQPRYHDRIIRHEEELSRIREYISNNPAKWEQDDVLKNM